MEEKLLEQVKEYMRANAMVSAGETVTVAVSGGADSVFLLLLMTKIAPEFGFSVEVVHVNHQLRGEAADEDERFVGELCQRLGVPFQAYRCDVAALAFKQGIGEEEAGRVARRAIYAKSRLVALAHHLDDQAETFLFRAARGSSLTGLSGMRPVERLEAAEGGEGTRVIRPLLTVPRAKIEACLSAIGQDWREDESNRDETYARNAIRASVIPQLESKVNAEAARHFAEAAESIRAADEFLRAEAAKRAEGILRVVPSVEGDEPHDEVVLFDELLDLPEALQGCLVLDALHRAAGTRRDFGRLHVEQVRALFSLPAGKRAELPHGVAARRERGNVRLSLLPGK